MLHLHDQLIVLAIPELQLSAESFEILKVFVHQLFLHLKARIASESASNLSTLHRRCESPCQWQRIHAKPHGGIEFECATKNTKKPGKASYATLWLALLVISLFTLCLRTVMPRILHACPNGGHLEIGCKS